MNADSEMADNITMDASEGAINIENYRKLVQQFCDMRRYRSALFWAEKVCCFSDNDLKDVYNQAQCMFLLKEYHRAAHVIRLHDLEHIHIRSYNLLLQCLYEAKEYKEAISIIDTVDVVLLTESLVNEHIDDDSIGEPSMLFGDESVKNDILSSILLLKGKIYEATDNHSLAIDYYVQALHKSIYCYEALDALVQHETLMSWEEKELMRHLPLELQSYETVAKLITKLYEAKLKNYYEAIEPESNGEETPIRKITTLKYIKELNDKIEISRISGVDIYQNAVSMPVTRRDYSYMSLPKRLCRPSPQYVRALKYTKQWNDKIELCRILGVTTTYDQRTWPTTRLLFQLNFLPDASTRYSHAEVLSLTNESLRPKAYKPNRKRYEDNGNTENTISLSACLISTDVMAAKAVKYFYNEEYKNSLEILNKLLEIDPNHDSVLTIKIGCLVDFHNYNQLYVVANKLFYRYPDKAISLYAVGCYYHVIGKSEQARRYLSKATSLDRFYGPAWLAYGRSFAKENEHDQAMAAYFKAYQLMRGCHLPLFYIGVECGKVQNLELAERFSTEPKSILPMDVFVLHEMGLIQYKCESYESAEEVFRTTADIVKKRAKQNNKHVSARWEPLFNNLGHCCRKNKKFNDALEFHQYALLLKPQSSKTLTAIGFVYALMGDLEEAITYFDKSLALNRECKVSKKPTQFPANEKENKKFTAFKLKFDDVDISDILKEHQVQLDRLAIELFKNM